MVVARLPFGSGLRITGVTRMASKLMLRAVVVCHPWILSGRYYHGYYVTRNTSQ